MANVVSVGEAKRRLSEIMSRVLYKGERFIIQRRGKPMAVLVSADDLDRLEQVPLVTKGVLAAVAAWADFEDLDQVVEEIYQQRQHAQDRPVALER